jgi:FKBP-type peptidyl-prolyl cis-trans isomerase
MTKICCGSLLSLSFLVLAGCNEGGKGGGSFAKLPPEQQGKIFPNGEEKVVTTPSGLKYEDTKVGTGAEAVAAKRVWVHYTGTLTDGKVFDSSLKRMPFDFTLGSGQVIKGWDEGIVGMKEGGKRKLLIPSALAYGSKGAAGGAIPADSDLVFDVELIKVQ